VPIRIKYKNLNLFLTAIIIFMLGYGTGRAGFVADQKNGKTVPVISREAGKPDAIDFSLFWDAWNIVDRQYVREINNQDRLYGSIAGMIAGLGDPFSGFMKPEEAARLSDDLNGNFDGIGAELVQKENLITVVAPIDDSPAKLAGILPGDVIAKIDNQAAPASVEEAVKLIRGKAGTQVTLTILRDGKLKDIAIVRARVEIKNVTYRKDGAIGVIKINQFSDNVPSLLDAALKQAQAEAVTGLVLDLRNDPGGLLDISVQVASRFIDPGVVVIERDKNKQEISLRTDPAITPTKLPLVVLVNKGSASASEIVAGAIQDALRAKLVGETTFGKGSVQAIEPLPDGSVVRITTAEWLTPKKREINKLGIKPDQEVTLTEEDVTANRDPQLDKAKALLSQ
jgi:carboxyl-terminal processing protease